MNSKTLSLLSILSLLGAGTIFAADATKPVAGKVTVIFDHPENFTDVKDAFMPTDKGRAAILNQIRQFVETKAASFLGSGQALEVKLTEIDLAGEFEPERGPQLMDVRIVKELYAPRFDLEFKLTGADGKVISEGKRKLRDLNFMGRLTLPSSEPLRFERDILKDWLHDEIKSAKAPGG
jgi:hypothetical protein